METGPRLKVSFDRLVKPGIEPVTPGLQGKRFIHYTTAAPMSVYISCARTLHSLSSKHAFLSLDKKHFCMIKASCESLCVNYYCIKLKLVSNNVLL